MKTTGRGRDWNRHKTHCKYGHEFSPENTYLTMEGSRACRACGRARKQRGKGSQK